MVLRLTAQPNCWLNRSPAAPPNANPIAVSCFAMRPVRLAFRSSNSGYSLCKDAAKALLVKAEKLPYPQLQGNAVISPGQIRQRALVVAMNSMCGMGADWALCNNLDRANI
jgi:hypothetical protein